METEVLLLEHDVPHQPFSQAVLACLLPPTFSITAEASLTYAEAQLMMDDAGRKDPVTSSLRGLNSLAKILKQRRIQNGALTLASPEVRFHIDSETHDPIDLQTKELK
ncbi:exosome complex exonuclease RRP44-like [Petromyzon marinus]|uniref:exosome complex exonuclease RRP44-like n=1 Tax=Petromyzon marinus TaxID=7757 RepID=UPI003F72A6EB